MKKQLALATAALMALSLAACGNTATASSAAESTAESTSTAASSEAASTDSTAADDGDVLQQAAAAAFANDVTLTMWGAEEDQELLRTIADNFIKEYGNYGGKITINLGTQSESEAKDTVLTDPTAAADVYAFADDQLNELVQAGALQEVQLNADDIKSRNTAASVDAATLNGKLYAYPLTADNGYFMFYDSSVFTEDDVQSLDAMIEAAKKANKKIAMNVSDAWYVYSFFQGAGLDLTLNDDGLTNTCTWNQAGGTDVAQAILDLFKTGAFVDMDDPTQATAIAEGTICAAVNGTWRAADAQAAWGENYAAAKLPTYTVAGKQVQMASFSGCKLIGVNPHSKNVGWSMLLAEYLTSEDTQVTRFKQRGLGPSNINASESEEVKADPAISALAAQAAYATPQRVGGNYWTPAETLGSILAQGNPDGTDLQKLLDNAVEGIEAPVSQE